jgi:hypothetical protein
MKPILITVILFGGAIGSSSSHVEQPALNFKPVAQSSKDPTREGLPVIPYDEKLRQVAGLAKQAGIANLRDAKLSDAQTEIRIWKGFGLVYPRCFILAVSNGIPTASLTAPRVKGTKAVFRKGKAVYANTRLNEPCSGWDNLFAYLKEYGIGSTIDLALDKHYLPYPDAEDLVLEMKNSSHYSMVYYIDSTTTADGKKAFGICQKMETEFHFHLGCQL